MTINAVYDPKLWLQPSTPTPAMSAEFRAAARALLNAEAHAAPFRLLDAEDAPEETCDGSEAADFLLTPRCIVRVVSSPSECPLFVRVVKLLANDSVLVQDLTVPAVRWRERLDNGGIGLTAEAVEVGGE